MAHEVSPLATHLTRGASGEASKSHIVTFAMSEWPAGLANGEVSG